MKDRYSISEKPKLVKGKKAIAEKESKNTLAQFDWAMAEVHDWIDQKRHKLKPSLLLRLNWLALESIDVGAGNFRTDGVKIKHSNHKPIDGPEVPDEVEEMLEYLSDNWERKTPIHLAAYAMWRVNWIHPFYDGNGRTARIFSYMILCAKTDFFPSKGNTIPEQISANKPSYYNALEHADNHSQDGQVDVSEIENLLTGYLSQQLLGVHKKATGKTISEDQSKPNENQSWIKRDSRLSKWYDKMEKRPVLTGTIVTIGLAILGYFLV